jgi:ubiquinone/menaquinone biosynthesis C-methylase UbiE
LTGVDLTQEFCHAARELNSLCGMAEQVRIVEGSALSLPLPNAVFDRAFSQFMVMNVADKTGVGCASASCAQELAEWVV